MAARKPRPTPPAVRPRDLPVHRPDAAGIDVGAAEHYVAIAPDRDPQPVRRFAAFTADLQRLADWLIGRGITTVAMEAAGAYWAPLFELLERRGLEVFLVDPRQAQAVKGRPTTDRLDCQWVQRLHGCGLLAASFRPPDQVVVLRGHLRQRQMLIRYASGHVQHMQKALEQMNVKLTEVVADVTGKTAMDVIRAILAGWRDPAELAKLRNEHCKVSEAGLARALEGNWREEHLFALRQAVALWEYYQGLVRECDRAIERCLGTLPDRAEGRRLPPRPRAQAQADRAGLRRPRAGASGLRGRPDGHRGDRPGHGVGDPGGGRPGPVPLRDGEAILLVAGPVPAAQQDGGQGEVQSRAPGRQSRGPGPRLAARGLHASKSALGAFYRRMRARLGAPKALVATAHKLARLVYALLTRGEAYVAQAMDDYERTYEARKLQGLERAAKALGYRLEPIASG
jgi:hypothetical protein